MESSTTLLNAQIQLLDTQLALIHIPLHLYRNFLQAILQLVLPSFKHTEYEDGNGAVQPHRTWPYQHPFINISITPIECSVVCSRKLAEELFTPVLPTLDAQSRTSVHITPEDFVVMQVDGEGLDAGQRVLDLTSPLALAGISIFFITTYFCDYILVPSKYQSQVVKTLEERGFQFDKDNSTYVNSFQYNRRYSNTALEVKLPSTPPPATISELQMKTFATLKRSGIAPVVDSELRLIQCAGQRDGSNGMSQSRSRNSPMSSAEDALHLGLVKCLINSPYPRFLSLTLTDEESASLLLDHTLLPNFAQHSLLGANSDEHLVPITLDLRSLPVESTGIVCGVAGRLVGGTSGQLQDSVEMSYLSTARAGTVMVHEDEIERALTALRGAEKDGLLSQGD